MIENIRTYKFPEDRFEALKEGQRLSGLSQTEFDVFLKVLSKGFSGSVGFGRPDEFSIVFGVSALVLSVTVDFDTGLVDKRVEFRFSLKELGLSDEEPGYDWRNEHLMK
jgi:hypothetical protein